tara:strand:+ start:2249 stop:2788 length:540 start_codon:yes stop_codon:yes gene_type:complete
MSLSIYIPRMLGSVNKKTVYEAFNSMGIGSVTELDMIYKVNENRNPYYFAFVKLNPYNTPQSNALQYELNKNKESHLVYDEEAGQYWEIKKYIPREQRNQENVSNKHPIKMSESITITEESSLFHTVLSIWTPITPIIESFTHKIINKVSAFTEDDKQDLVKEYEQLEREIYNRTMAFI